MNYAEGCRILYFDTGAGNNAPLESASYPTNALGVLNLKMLHMLIYTLSLQKVVMQLIQLN